MRAAMGDDPMALRRGAGVMFGFGADDDEDYLSTNQDSDEEIDLLTGIPIPRGVVPKGSGFGGRVDGWGRRAEVLDPSGPAPANTLLAPDPLAKSVQSFMFEYAAHDSHDEQQPLPVPAHDSIQEQEDALFHALAKALDRRGDAR